MREGIFLIAKSVLERIERWGVFERLLAEGSCVRVEHSVMPGAASLSTWAQPRGLNHRVMIHKEL